MQYKVIFMLFVLFVGCQNSSSGKKEQPEKENKEKMQQTSVSPKDTVTLIKGSDSILISKKKIVEDYDQQWSVINYEFFNENRPLSKCQRTINKFIRKSFYQPEQAKEYSEPLSKELIRKVLQSFQVEALRYEDDMGMVWNIYETYHIIDTYKKFASLKIASSIYTGGAHGMYGVGHYHFDKATGKELNLKDFLRVDNHLLKLAESAFRKTVGIKAKTPFEDTDFSFGGKFYLPDNFELTEQAIRFTYNPYEISNWAEGMIEFTLTKGQIQPYLKREI